MFRKLLRVLHEKSHKLEVGAPGRIIEVLSVDKLTGREVIKAAFKAGRDVSGLY